MYFFSHTPSSPVRTYLQYSYQYMGGVGYTKCDFITQWLGRPYLIPLLTTPVCSE